MDGNNDQRSPEERKCDEKRQIINAKQLYSNGHLIETVGEEEDSSHFPMKDDDDEDIENRIIHNHHHPKPPKLAHPYMDRNRMTTVMEPAPDTIVLGFQ